MAGTRVELNGRGFVELLQSDGVQNDLQRRAEAIASAAGDGFVVEQMRTTSSRSRVAVKADTVAAKRAESENGALSRAIDAGRG